MHKMCTRHSWQFIPTLVLPSLSLCNGRNEMNANVRKTGIENMHGFSRSARRERQLKTKTIDGCRRWHRLCVHDCRESAKIDMANLDGEVTIVNAIVSYGGIHFP